MKNPTLTIGEPHPVDLMRGVAHAYLVTGPHLGYHLAEMGRLEESWPTMHKAVKSIATHHLNVAPDCDVCQMHNVRKLFGSRR